MVKSLKKPSLLIIKSVKEAKEQKDGFLGMLIDTLITSL